MTIAVAAPVRYGVKENLYGIDMIRTSRTGQPGVIPTQNVMQSITTFSNAFMVVNIEFRCAGESRIGRQSQSWGRVPDG